MALTLANQISDWKRAVGSTSGIATVDLITLALVTGRAYSFEMDVIGKANSSADSVVSYQRSSASKVGGTWTIVGSLVSLATITSTALIGCSATLVISGSNIIVRATGIALQNVDWTANLKWNECI